VSSIRIMTFNIAGAINTEDDGENSWAKRAQLNVQTIKRYTPDLIGFQQLDDGNLQTYQQHLLGYEYVLGPETDEPDLHDYNAIYWKPTSLELLESGGFYLSRTPQSWSRDWDSVCVRAATWARLRTLDERKEVLHINTHLDHIGEKARVEGTKLILQHLSERRGNELAVILTGDFNCNPWAPGYRIYVETTFTDMCYHLVRTSGFVDTFLAVGGEDSEASYTFHGFEGERYWAARHHMAGRIDWILTLNGKCALQTTSTMIVRDHESPVYPSDHYPVVSDLVLSS
jgi:endonuclease/exonuclease/phosphatase family metal-dependent hydrolase